LVEADEPARRRVAAKQLSAIFRREPKLIGQPVNNIAEADFFAC
jgi:hypothetical protein